MSFVRYTHYGYQIMKKNKIGTILLIVTPILIGIGSAILTKDMMVEYGSIKKPFLSPPASIFPIAWTILYILMGAGAAIVYSSDTANETNRRMGLLFHAMQLILNFFWSIIFFNAKEYLLAFVWLILLWLAVLSMLLNYKKISKSAFILNIPYIVWLTFAGYLNLAVFLLN